MASGELPSMEMLWSPGQIEVMEFALQ